MFTVEFSARLSTARKRKFKFAIDFAKAMNVTRQTIYLWEHGAFPKVEHIKPISKGGKTKLYNLALATKTNNHTRGNLPIKYFLDSEKFIAYVEQFKDVELPNFNGKEYIGGLIKTILDTLEGKQ